VGESNTTILWGLKGVYKKYPLKTPLNPMKKIRMITFCFVSI